MVNKLAHKQTENRLKLEVLKFDVSKVYNQFKNDLVFIVHFDSIFEFTAAQRFADTCIWNWNNI